MAWRISHDFGCCGISIQFLKIRWWRFLTATVIQFSSLPAKRTYWWRDSSWGSCKRRYQFFRLPSSFHPRAENTLALSHSVCAFATGGYFSWLQLPVFAMPPGRVGTSSPASPFLTHPLLQKRSPSQRKFRTYICTYVISTHHTTEAFLQSARWNKFTRIDLNFKLNARARYTGAFLCSTPRG